MIGNTKEQIKYFRGNIFEAKIAYNAWKMLYGARCIPIVGKELAENYTKIQKNYPAFFMFTERAYLMMYVMLLCHPFDDKRNDSYSLDKLGKTEYDAFMSDQFNQKVVKMLKKARHKLFAHRDNRINPQDIKFPSIDSMNKFFAAIEGLYNKITARIADTHNLFNNAEDVKYEIERLHLDLDVGRDVNLKRDRNELIQMIRDNKISDKI